MSSRRFALCGVAFLLLLTGCSAKGTFSFSENTVNVDLVLADAWLCNESASVPPGITARNLPGEQSCEITGTAPLASLPESDPSAWLDTFVSKHDGVWQVVVPATFLGRTADPGELDIRMDFPTPVAFAAGGGTINGASVRWTDMTAARIEGIAALTHAPTNLMADWFGSAILGGLLGATGAAGVGYWRRRREAGQLEERCPPSSGASPVPSAPRLVVDAVPSPPEDPDIWSQP